MVYFSIIMVVYFSIIIYTDGGIPYLRFRAFLLIPLHILVSYVCRFNNSFCKCSQNIAKLNEI